MVTTYSSETSSFTYKRTRCDNLNIVIKNIDICCVLSTPRKMNRHCFLYPTLRTMLFVVWQHPLPPLGYISFFNKPTVFYGFRTTSFFCVWQPPCYIDWWTDYVTFSLVLEPCCLLSDCRPVSLVDELSIIWSLVLRTMLFAIGLSFYCTGWWTDPVICFVVLKPCCFLSDSLPVALVDEQTLSFGACY